MNQYKSANAPQVAVRRLKDLDAEAEVWKSQEDSVPSVDDLRAARSKWIDLKTEAERAEIEYKRAAAERSCVIGQHQVMDELELDTNGLHVWKRYYIPELEDYSRARAKNEDRREFWLEKLKADPELLERYNAGEL